MGRFTPRESRLSGGDVFAQAGDFVAELLRRPERKKAEAEEQRDRELATALRALETDRLGLREGTAPTRAVPKEQDIFADERLGMGRGATGPSGLGLSLEAARRMRPSEFDMGDPNEILHAPGSFIRGVGFTEKAITRADLAAMRRDQAYEPKQAADPRYKQLTDSYYLDTEGTPQAQEARTAASRQLRLLDAARRAGASPQDIAALEADPSMFDDIYERLTAEEEQPTIDMMGRQFPDTPEGRDSALAWREASMEAGRADGDKPGSQPRITGEVTRRTMAMAAANAVTRIQERIRGMTDSERRHLEPGEVRGQIQRALQNFGFQNIQELQEEQRALRLTGVGGRPSSATDGDADTDDRGGAGGVSDAEIDAALRANPDATTEEILEMLTGGP